MGTMRTSDVVESEGLSWCDGVTVITPADFSRSIMMMMPSASMPRRPDEAPNYEAAPMEHKNEFNPYMDNGG